MKKTLAFFIACILLIAPCFVNSKGVEKMATGMLRYDDNSKYKDTSKPNGSNTSDTYVNRYGQTIHSGTREPRTPSINPVTPSRPSYEYDTLDGPLYEAPNFNALYQAQLQSRLNSLQQARDSALSGLDSEASALKNTYYNKRNQVGAQNDVGAFNFAQFMASKGVQGNAAALPEIYRNNALQSNIGALNQQEAQNNADINSRRSQINSAYEQDVAAAQADNEAQMLQATINQYNQDRAYGLQQAQLDAENNKYNTSTKYNMLQNEKSDYANTVGQFANNYKAEYDRIANDGDKSNDWQLSILAAARQNKIDEAQKKYQQQGYVSEDIADALNLPVGTMTQAYAAKMNNAAAKEAVDNALQLFNSLGYLTPQMAQILQSYGLPTDAQTLSKLRTEYSTNKPYYKPSTGGSNNDYSLKW